MALQKNLGDELFAYAKTLPIVQGHVWEASLLLRIGASLAEGVNKYPGLNGQQKSELVVQTVLRLLDDGEKAEKERSVESTGTETTKVPWEELRHTVRTLLPQTLNLIVSAARGEFDLAKAVPVVAPALVSCCVGWLSREQPAKGVKPSSPQIQSNPLPLAQLPPKERATLEVREPLPPQ
jgi:hypothetical protein